MLFLIKYVWHYLHRDRQVYRRHTVAVFGVQVIAPLGDSTYLRAILHSASFSLIWGSPPPLLFFHLIPLLGRFAFLANGPYLTLQQMTFSRYTDYKLAYWPLRSDARMGLRGASLNKYQKFST